MNAIDLAAAELEACCCKKRKPKTRRGPRADTFVRLGEEALELASASRWDRFTARHLVALWVKSHAHIYGVDPSDELAGKAGLAAVSAARDADHRDLRSGRRGDRRPTSAWGDTRQRENGEPIRTVWVSGCAGTGLASAS